MAEESTNPFDSTKQEGFGPDDQYHAHLTTQFTPYENNRGRVPSGKMTSAPAAGSQAAATLDEPVSETIVSSVKICRSSAIVLIRRACFALHLNNNRCGM